MKQMSKMLIFRGSAEGGTRRGLFAGVCRCPRRASFLVSLFARMCDCLLMSFGFAVAIAVRFRQSIHAVGLVFIYIRCKLQLFAGGICLIILVNKRAVL